MISCIKQSPFYLVIVALILHSRGSLRVFQMCPCNLFEANQLVRWNEWWLEFTKFWAFWAVFKQFQENSYPPFNCYAFLQTSGKREPRSGLVHGLGCSKQRDRPLLPCRWSASTTATCCHRRLRAGLLCQCVSLHLSENKLTSPRLSFLRFFGVCVHGLVECVHRPCVGVQMISWMSHFISIAGVCIVLQPTLFQNVYKRRQVFPYTALLDKAWLSYNRMRKVAEATRGRTLRKGRTWSC